MNKFTDILLQDGSTQTLNPLLQKAFPGRFTKKSPAATELHAFFSLRYNNFINLHMAPDKQSEYLFMPEKDKSLKGTLSLFDRGYCSIKRLHKIEVSEGYFTCRWKNSANPKIIRIVAHRRRDRTMVGKRLKECKLKAKLNYDFEVKFGENSPKFECLRFIAIWNPKTQKHVYFVSNAKESLMTVEEIGEIYRIRWQIELVFKDLKSHSGLRKFLTSSEYIVQGLIWLSLIAFIVRRYFVAMGQVWLGKQLSFFRAGISARLFMPDLMKKINASQKQLEIYLLELFAFFDDMIGFSNPKRKNTLQTIGLTP